MLGIPWKHFFVLNAPLRIHCCFKLWRHDKAHTQLSKAAPFHICINQLAHIENCRKTWVKHQSNDWTKEPRAYAIPRRRNPIANAILPISNSLYKIVCFPLKFNKRELYEAPRFAAIPNPKTGQRTLLSHNWLKVLFLFRSICIFHANEHFSFAHVQHFSLCDMHLNATV